MKTLKDVAKVYKDQALRAINPGVPYSGYKTGTSRAIKTGKMFNQVAQSNVPERMFTKDKSGKITFTFTFSNPDYAKYVQYGTSKMEARPFAQIAAQSVEFKKAKDAVMNVEASKVLDGVFANLDKLWKAGGDNLTIS
jgi:hypothetical protein